MPRDVRRSRCRRRRRCRGRRGCGRCESTAPTPGPAPEPIACHDAVVRGDVVGRGDPVQVDELPARVEGPVAVGRQGVDAAVDVAVAGDGRARHRRWSGRRPGGSRRTRSRPRSAKAPPTYSVLPMTWRALTLPPNGRPGHGRVAERRPADAVPDGQEVGVGVAAGVDERAARVDLAGVVGDREDVTVRDRACPFRAPHAVPFQVAIRAALALPPAEVKLPPTRSTPGSSAFRA